MSAQNGPGGVGNADGSDGEPELKLWLLPDSLGLSNNDDVLTWTDYSGNSNDLSAVSATSPVFKASAINNHDYLEFSKDNNRIVRNTFDMPTNAVAVFMVLRTGDSGDGVLSYAVTGSDNEYLFYQSNSLTTYLSGSNDNSNIAYNDNSWKIFGHQWRSSDGRLYIHIDGTEEDNPTFQSGATITTGGNIAIGGEQDGVNSGYNAGQDFDGDIAEFIMFGSSLKQADRVVIENYLAQKYGLDANLPQDNYVPDDASYNVALTGMGKESDGTTEASCDGLVITQNGGFDNGEYLLTAHDGAVNTEATLNTSSEVTNAGVDSSWNRAWYIDKTTVSGGVNAKIAFDFGEGINGKYPGELSNYELLYRSNLTSDYSIVTTENTGVQNGDQIYFSVTDANLSDGYYTLGSTDAAESPLTGVEGQTWYTLKSGDWEDWETWTLDPSGALPDNPANESPAAIDDVVILSGKTVTVNTDNISANELTVNGRLDFQSYSGQSFGTIKGSGRILLSGDNFPAGDASHFVTEGKGEGTVVYYGADNFKLDTILEFYNLEVEMNNTDDTLTLLKDYTLNGDFYVNKGTFRINSDTSDNIDLAIDLEGALLVEENGAIITGEADARHQFNIYGDFTNNGTVAFTNRSVADYNNEANDGIIDINFLNNSADQRISCNATTNFYRIEIDKGTDETYQLIIEASNSGNFNLFGYASENHGETSQLTDNNNALGLISGTVRLKDNVNVPVLNNTGNYNISESARLWIDGGYAAKSNGTAIVPYGKIRVSSGTLEATVNSGITTRGNGLIKVEGGTLTTRQIRTSVFGSANVGGYVQNGGNVNVTGGNINTDYYTFSLTYPGNVFSMSGGTLHVSGTNSPVTGSNSGQQHGGAVFIASDESNHNVTGGTVIVEVDDDDTARVTSTAPFYNFKAINTAGNATVMITEGTSGDDDTDPDEYTTLNGQELKVLNDLTIEAGGFLNHNGNDVTIGGDFNIHEDAAQQSGDNNYGYLYDPALPNITTFNGDDHATFYIGHPDSEVEEWELYMNRLVLNKPSGKHLIVDSDTENDVYNVSGSWKARILRLDSIKVESGILNQTDYSVRLIGNVINYDQIGVYDGSTDDDAYIMFAWNSYDIETSDNAIFGNIKVNAGNNIISFSSDVYIKRMWYRHGKINAGKHNLKIDEIDLSGVNNETQFDWDQDGSIQGDEQGVLSPMDMFVFTGNVSDGGLSLKVTGNGSYTFPIGIGTDATEYLHNTSKYTPAEATISNFSDDGYITITPVDAELQTTDLSGGDILSYYWNVDYEGFTTEPTVEYDFYYYESDLDGSGNENSFVPGKVLDGGDYTRSYENDNSQVSDEPDTDGIWNKIVFNDHDNGGNGFTLENANYTAGESNRFVGSPEIYYSVRNSGWGGYDWDNNTSWYNGPNSTTNPPDYPTAGDIAVIRGNNGQDGINVSGTQEAAEVIMQREGTYTDIEDLPRLRFEPTDQLTAGKISGVGDLYLRQDIVNGPTLNADIGEFAKNDTSLVEFYMDAGAGTYSRDEADFFSELPTIRIYGDNNSGRIASFNYDFKCKNLIVDGEGGLYIAGNYTVENRTRLGYTGDGRIIFPNGTDSYTYKTGDFVTGRGKNQFGNNFELTVETGGGNGIEHFFEVERNIDLNFADAFDEGTCTIDLFSTLNDNNVILHLSGTGIHTFNDNYSDGNSSIELYKIKMNKGTDQSSTFTFNDDFTLSGPTSGANVEKALIMENGTLLLDDPDIDIDLTTGDNDFYIPGKAALELRQGTARASGNSGILLDGKLHINGGTVDMSGGDNYIEYSASGNATIEVSADSLIVGSQIRRGLTSTEGILNYTQTDGTVVVGNNTAPENNRGVLEILNSGSSFNFTGGDLYIARAQDNPSTASFYLDPETHNWANSSKLHIGYSNTSAGEEISIFSRISAHKLVVDSSSNNSFTAQQWTVPLRVNDTLEIQSNTTFDANGQNLTLKGDLIVDGTYTPNNNTTYISGSSLQEVTGSPAFWNLIKDQNNILRLNDEFAVNNELRLNNGTIDDNGNTLHAKGNVWMDATHIHGSGGDGIAFDGTEPQELQSNGGTITFGKLSINNPGGSDSIAVSVPEGNIITIEDTLQMEMGIFDVGRNLVVLEENAEIWEKSSFSSNNMIQTNISFTDAGIKKYFPEITSNTSFTYPIGSKGKYTPVEFIISSKDAGGSIRVKAADEIHPSVINDDEPCDQIHDTSNVLKYHWIIEADGITNFSADAYMKYYEEDIQIDNSLGTSYDTTSYIAARLLYGSLQWNKYGPSTFNEDDQQIEIPFTSTDDQGISGDYTAGIEDQDGACEGAIPDEIAIYISTANGNWTDDAIWDTYPEGGGTVPGGGPKGAAVIIEDTVTIQKNYIVGYKTTIDTAGVDTSGLLKLGTTYGHRLGLVDGKGTLQLERGDLPAGVYEEFFSADGGTLEFSGTANYDVLGGISQLNNLKFSGTGDRRLANLDVGLYGNLHIMGDDNNLRMINEHDRNQTVQGDITFTQGQVDAGNSLSTLLLNGNSLQTIRGNFEDSNAFNYLELNNSFGLEILDSVEVDEIFTLNDGMVYLPDTGLVTLTSTASGALSGAASNRYIQGPLRKRINNGDTYTFEVGDTSRYGKLELSNTSPTTAEYWEVQYYNNETHPAYDTSSYESSLERISNNEYWRVKGPGATSDAFVKIRWDDQSVLPAQTSNRSANLRIAEWNTGASEWQSVGSDVTDNGVTSGTVRTNSAVALEEHVFTLASTEPNPQATAAFSTEDTAVCVNEIIQLIATLSGQGDITFTVNKDGTPYDTITANSEGDTIFIINSAAVLGDAGTYSIDSVGDDNGTGYVYGDPVTVTVNPLPTVFNVIGGGSVCDDDSVEVRLDGSVAGINYELYRNSTYTGIVAGGTGDTISFGYFDDPADNGNYEVLAINSSTGCERYMNGIVNVTINIVPDPEPYINETNPICFDGNDITLYANDVNSVGNDFSWTPAGVLNDAGAENPDYLTSNPGTPSDTTMFNVTVTDTGTGCQATDSVQVILLHRPVTGNQYHIPNDFDQ